MKTAESVSPGHPDKICDQISDAILDECLRQDPDSRVAIETCGGHGIVTITGELTTKAYVNMADIAKRVYKECGYNDEIGVQINVVQQSPDISQGVDTGGAGDQGIMVGYACNDNEEMIPQELYLARKILKEVLALGYGPDGKSQVTLDDNGKITNLVVSVQHKEDDNIEKLRNKVGELGLKYNNGSSVNVIVNGTGKFVIGGFAADTGLTGRKIVNDAYGPRVSVGGGAYSGKEGTKVDRSAAYMARKIAIDYLKKYSAYEVQVNLAYSIGVAEPVMAEAYIITNDDVKTVEIKDYDLTPQGIIKYLDLKKPIYRETASWGAYGNSKFSWEK